MRVVHYLNQFYGRLGGEEAADAPLAVRDAPVGPGTRLSELLAPADARLVGTVICGDNLAAEEPAAFGAALTDALRDLQADVLVAGPAFNAGRYGLACGEACRQAGRLGIPAVTAMYGENPGVDLYRR